MKPLNLLLVDDEAAFLDTITKRLRKRNLKVETAMSGSQALDAMARLPHLDVVVLDVKMPQKDGIQTLVDIKQDYPLVEVIMLTGHATVETAIEGMKLGAFDYLMKPCEMDVLMEKVHAAGGKKRGHEEKISQARIQEIITRRP